MSELKIDCICRNMYGMNSYVVSADDEAVIIDACKLPQGYESYKKLLEGKKLVKVIYTHGHFDHISGADDIRKEFPNTNHCVHNLDYDFFQDGNLNVSSYLGSIIQCQSPEIQFNDGDTFKLKDIEFKVIHTPGHTRGGVCYYTEGHLFCGDTIFAYGIGRTDFPTGDFSVLENSISQKIFALDDDTLLYPGHDAYGVKLSNRKKNGSILTFISNAFLNILK
ncbi:MBL fold metallo-hydrolase [uncultured Brachyspira sp.]|uniref:MBL fold metallo-hydrolase n=1 Tax=uncultured Brachyspira sp. TaxID=221953 RepID=UPI0025FFCC2E|nr:MBL fold metallo-hydrolase [uncultured Brachyspira sp.]